MAAKTTSVWLGYIVVGLALVGAVACGGSDDATTASNTACRMPPCGQPADAGGDAPFISVPDGGDSDATSEPGPCASETFELSETQEAFEIPANVTFMHIKAWGSGGNGEGQCPSDDSGLGGYSEAIFEVTPGTPLIIIVGKRGRAGDVDNIMRFGFGNWGGGGLSGVFLGPDLITESDSAKALVIAGGGGGASAPGCHPGGTGNHPESGGRSTMLGGAGADDVNSGGGGYRGGTGGGRLEGGRGGSGFIADGTSSPLDSRLKHIDSRMLHAEPQTGVPPQVNDPDYDGIAAKGEQNGRVVIHFSCDKPVIVPR